jgi:hypothetical protein
VRPRALGGRFEVYPALTGERVYFPCFCAFERLAGPEEPYWVAHSTAETAAVER